MVTSFLCGVDKASGWRQESEYTSEIFLEGNNCSEEGEMTVASIDWVDRGGSKLKSPKVGPSIECAENSLPWLEWCERKGE